MAHEASSRKPRSLSQSQSGKPPNTPLNPVPGPPSGSGNTSPTSSPVHDNAHTDQPAPHINLPSRSALDELLEQLSPAPDAGQGAVPRSPRLLRTPVTPFNSPATPRQRQDTPVPTTPATASQLQVPPGPPRRLTPPALPVPPPSPLKASPALVAPDSRPRAYTTAVLTTVTATIAGTGIISTTTTTETRADLSSTATLASTALSNVTSLSSTSSLSTKNTGTGLAASHGRTISTGAIATFSRNPGAASSVTRITATTSTTSTTANSAITTTTSTGSLPSVAETATESGKSTKETSRHKEGAGMRRHRSMDRIVDPGSVPGNKLPEKLAKPEAMAEKLARAETLDFDSIATRMQEGPYHGDFPDAAAKDHYQTMWLPYQALLATRLEPHFDEVDTAIKAVFPKWQELLEALDGEAALRKRAELMPYAHVSESSRERLAKNVARVAAKDLCDLPQVREMVTPTLDPLIKAIHGKGTSLLNSGLSPILLYFLLELDRQHTGNWQIRSKDQLQWQLLWCHAREGFLLIEGLRKKGKEAEPALIEQVRKDLLALQDYQAGLEAGGKKTSAELRSYKALIASQLTPELVSLLESEAEQHDAIFEQIRRSAIAAFIGQRGCSAILKLRHTDADKNSDKARLYLVLARLLAWKLDRHPIVDKLMTCDADEREQVRRAALKDFAQEQEAWKGLCKDQVASLRWKSLIDAKRPGQKRGKKPVANYSLTRSDRTPERNDADSTKHLGQPGRFLSDAQLFDRRRKRAREFLDKHGIEDKAKSVPELADKNLEESLIASPRGKGMLERFNSFLDETIVSKDGDPSKDLVKLRSELGSTLVALRTPGTPRGKSPSRSQNNSGTSSGASTPPRSPDSSSTASSANTPSPLAAASQASVAPETQDMWSVIDRSPALSRRPYKPGPFSRSLNTTEPQDKPQEKPPQEKPPQERPPQDKQGASDQ